MPAVSFWLGCVGFLAATGPPSTPAWSPDGSWLAYVQEVRPARPAIAPGWLFESGPVTPAPASAPEAATSYRLWAFRPENGEAVVLEEGASPLSDPSWSRDGASLAFGRLVAGTDAPSRWEVVVQDAPHRRRVAYRETIIGAVPSPEEVRTLAPSWSPDGRTLAVPTIKVPGVTLVGVTDGRVLRAIEGASRPAWSLDEGKLAYFLGEFSTEVAVLDSLSGSPRRLAQVPPDRDRLPGPFWSRDGQTLVVLRRGPNEVARPGAPAAGEALQSLSIRVDSGRIDLPQRLVHDPIAPEGGLIGAWYASDPEGESAFYATASPGRFTPQITWRGARADEVQKRFNPFDESARLGALAVAPGGRNLALRVEIAGTWSPPALCEPLSEHFVCVAPDDATRGEWLARIFEALLPILREDLPTPSLADGTAVARPSLLPAPGELDPRDPAASRMGRLARLGLPLIGPSSEANDEIRLALAYLSGDHAAALEALDALDARTEESDRRSRLMAVRAQVLLARGDYGRARPIIAHLREVGGRRTFAVEERFERPRLVAITDPRDLWPEFLAEKLVSSRNPPADGESPTER